MAAVAGTATSGTTGRNALNTNSAMMITESQLRIDSLAQSLRRMADTTSEITSLTDGLARRARHLDSLTSPASETSAMLTQSANNLNSTLSTMKDAREKFDTVQDCEPAIQRLLSGAQESRSLFEASGGAKAAAAAAAASPNAGAMALATHGGNLTEQDVYAAVDSMEIIRDAYAYFLERRSWRSTPSALGGLERAHTLGVDAMCLLIGHHLQASGAAVKLKQNSNKSSGSKKNKGKDADNGRKVIPTPRETAAETRLRLSKALQNRDLMKAVGEHEECLPMDSRPVRELRAVFECLGGEAAHLGPNPMDMVLRSRVKPEMSKVVRTEKVGSGGYCSLVNQPLRTGFPQLDSYGEARKVVAHASIDGYYRNAKAERKKASQARQGSGGGATDDRGGAGSLSDVDAAARDAVRCLEHAMVVVAGEKSVYRCVVAPTATSSSSQTQDKMGGIGSREYRDGLIMAYSYVVAAVVDRAMDIIETVFLKDAKTATPPVPPKDGLPPTDGAADAISVRVYGSAAAAGLRILDGVRMLGPSLAKLCDMSHEKDKGGGSDSASIASNLCIAIHRTTVKNAARTLENLAKAIQADPLDGEKHRPRDARVATVSSDVVRAIRLVSPFTSAYKSVTKRRALPWDPKMGDESNDLDSYVRFLIMRLLNSLQGKALNYTKDPGADASAKSTLFMMNNTFYLLEQLGASSRHKTKQLPDGEIDGGTFRIESPWFRDKVGKIFEAEKTKYVQHWEVLNSHLTSVDKSELTYQGGSDKLLSLESGRLIKSRFAGFIEDFEKLYSVHQPLAVVDPKLRTMLQRDVMNVFYPRYTRFFEKYSRIQFSKKNMDQYLKYPPARVEQMLSELFAAQ